MRWHTVSQSIVSNVLFLVCFAGGGSAFGVEAPEPVGVPRPSYPAGFAPGTRVTLLEDAPTLGAGLKTGMSGTVVCCDKADCTGSVLVSWDLWAGAVGTDLEKSCVTAAYEFYPPASLTWVDPAKVKLGQPFDKIGTLQEDPEGCLYLAADDGGLFYIVGGAEFRAAWWVVKPGNYVRLRGLLNRSPVGAKAQRACPQADGDVYHPIMSLAHWVHTACCDRWVCGFNYGDRVVLISEGDPYGAVNLPRGATGTIICCRATPEQSILVSWDLWGQGGADDGFLECTEDLNAIFPSHSTWWVSVKDVAKQFTTRCGQLQPIQFCVGAECLDPDAIGLFVRSGEVYYLAGAGPGRPLPDGRFQAMGLLTPYGKLVGGRVIAADTVIQADLVGMIVHPIIIACPEPSCCEPPYLPGDRVELLVDQPGGANGLLTGATGTVLCCNADDPVAPIFVSWDGWSQGNNDHYLCDAPLGWYPDKSGWWVACSEIKRLVLADLYDDSAGPRGFLPQTLVAGKDGQVLEVTGRIGNRGGADSEFFGVNIYVSVDDEITPEDYRIGSLGMQLAAGVSIEFSLQRAFPTNIPAGTYYVGWLIDPENAVREVDETNNTGIIETMKLTVTGGP